MKVISIFLISLVFGSANSKEAVPDCNINNIGRSISTLSPHISSKKVELYAKLIDKYSKVYGLNWKYLVAIIKQESNFKQDAVNCSSKGCFDFGLIQINQINISSMGLSHKKLLTDPDYSIKILSEFVHNIKTKYKIKDPMWLARYHSATPHFKHIYYELLQNHLEVIERVVSVDRGKKHQRFSNEFQPSASVVSIR